MNKFLLVHLLILVALSAGCNVKSFEKSEEMIINKMVSFDEVKEGSSKTITEANVIRTMQAGITGAKKRNGIFDIADPHYEVILEDEAYYLWLKRNEQGMIMNQKDTHALYTLKEKDTENLLEIMESIEMVPE